CAHGYYFPMDYW
nr:immunoglobulin heavy chain junction region [Mus musculus]